MDFGDILQIFVVNPRKIVLIIDETEVPKKGKATDYVDR
jgi:SRSO17 transposase